jgi:hypothetical protein
MVPTNLRPVIGHTIVDWRRSVYQTRTVGVEVDVRIDGGGVGCPMQLKGKERRDRIGQRSWRSFCRQPDRGID